MGQLGLGHFESTHIPTRVETMKSSIYQMSISGMETVMITSVPISLLGQQLWKEFSDSNLFDVTFRDPMGNTLSAHRIGMTKKRNSL